MHCKHMDMAGFYDLPTVVIKPGGKPQVFYSCSYSYVRDVKPEWYVYEPHMISRSSYIPSLDLERSAPIEDLRAIVRLLQGEFDSDLDLVDAEYIVTHYERGVAIYLLIPRPADLLEEISLRAVMSLNQIVRDLEKRHLDSSDVR